MRRVIGWLIVSAQVTCVMCTVAAADKDVPWRAQAEIARRGALVERINGIADVGDPLSALALAMQPPEDDSYKWLFTLVTTRNCQWCEQARRDFENDPKLKAWVDTRDYTKSWAHWQIVQIEDQSQAWRWKDFRPTSFPTLIVQPPVNGSWGDPHTIVFAHQGYLKPTELDAAIRTAIQQYAAKTYPRRIAGEAKLGVQQPRLIHVGLEQARGIEQSGGGWTPPVTPPSPLPPAPSYPAYPNVPPVAPSVVPDLGALLAQLLAGLFGGAGMANFLLLAILAWHIYRSFAKQEGIPLLLDDDSASQLAAILQQAARPSNDPSPTATSRTGGSASM
jgi:hypothetical protein